MEQFDLSQEVGNTAWKESFGFQCKITKTIFEENLRKFSPNAANLRKRQQPIQALRKQIMEVGVTDPKKILEIETLFEECKELESTLEEFESAPKEWEKEGKSQIVFTQEIAKPLNQIPYLLPTAAVFKIYVFPFFAVILPLLAWILPWIIVRVFFGQPLPFDVYIHMILNMWLGGKAWISMTFWEQLRVVFQSAWTAFGLFQSMYQPVQQALHIKKIDETIVKHGTVLQIFVGKVRQLFQALGNLKKKELSNVFLDEIPTLEPRQTYAYVREYPKDIQWIWRKIGEYELEYRLAAALHLTFVKYVPGKTICLEIEDFLDPSIPPELCITSSISLSGTKSHGLLTGPNKGGKSSTLRAICLNVWLAQTYGLAFARQMKLTPMAWIRSGLRLADIPGSESMFEKEIVFATKTLNLASSGRPGLVLYDECFHSTNPPDGEKTARLFLETLWRQKRVASLISTHIFSLVENAPPMIQRLCVPAEESINGIVYSFELAPGICKVSSVEEIHKKFGFPCISANAVKT